MFWSGNYIVVRELNFLLKEENVTLSQVLEADDILQECKADNKALIQFLTKPEILAELITLITEEPPKNVELASQYRHANIACEVLTSHLSMLSDRLSLDATQMNRLCDFINREPPLNPLLASYFSKTVEMLLERSPKQDCYLYHIVCLRVLDFFKSRRDFLPNLLRHMSTSAIADTFKYFIRLDDLFKKTVMEWLDEHQFLECLIQIVCGTYVPEELADAEKAEHETSEKPQHNHKDDSGGSDADRDKGTPAEAAVARARRRTAAAAAGNAAALLCELVASGCAGEAGAARSRTSWALLARLAAERGVRALLGGMFTSGAAARDAALVQGCAVLRALLLHEPALRAKLCEDEPAADDERSAVELAVAPHLPLLHHALLRPGDEGRVGLARLQVAALLAHLALSEVEEVARTLLTLGTPALLVELFFQHPNNNFLHAHVYTLLKHALTNRVFRNQYQRHLVEECGLLARLMEAWQAARAGPGPRPGYMGHVVLCLARLARALAQPDAAPLPPDLAPRWEAFRDHELRPLLQQHDTPLGGYHPSENIYEVEIMADTLAANYDFNDMAATASMDEMADDVNADDANEMCRDMASNLESPDFIADGLGIDDADNMRAAKSNFLELARQRFDDDMWDSPGEAEDEAEAEAEPAVAVQDLLDQHSPWESAGGGGAGEGWAHFDEPAPPAQDFAPFWAYAPLDPELEAGMRSLRLEAAEASSVELANNLLTAMSAMSPDAIANIVNANLPQPPPGSAPAPAPAEPPAPAPAAPAAPADPPAGPPGAGGR
ncbi:serine/threonine-protein phosphatase 6 regulatory subunit 3 isoform X1 [Helicoverpa zea]|uniref:serine/threonine-protein phosphatase 6 regulatory subunit 3 isoform X1 n=1 Tax=Helicoverpa zea TaxID=7113 RepID=UPI001F59D9EB|nr:serine/threonine-protein phosphatase 6 regulatory subunit 3 isoform X1 [Helicoverpa zea]